jgi:hypothetical protein
MERLEEEFCHLLAQNSRYVDPDWLFDSMAVAGSFRSSFDDDHHHTVDAGNMFGHKTVALYNGFEGFQPRTSDLVWRVVP